MSMFGAFGMAYNLMSDTSSTGSADRAGRRAQNKASELEARCDRLALLCEAMWTLLRDNLKLTDEQLIDRINQIDLTDGKLDGKASKDGVLKCHQCHRAVSKKFSKCMYCGALLARDPFS